MIRLVASIISFGVFLLDIVEMIIYVLQNTAINMWDGFWYCFMQYHNRIQAWTADGKDTFIAQEEDELEEDEQ